MALEEPLTDERVREIAREEDVEIRDLFQALRSRLEALEARSGTQATTIEGLTCNRCGRSPARPVVEGEVCLRPVLSVDKRVCCCDGRFVTQAVEVQCWGPSPAEPAPAVESGAARYLDTETIANSAIAEFEGENRVGVTSAYWCVARGFLDMRAALRSRDAELAKLREEVERLTRSLHNIGDADYLDDVHLIVESALRSEAAGVEGEEA